MYATFKSVTVSYWVKCYAAFPLSPVFMYRSCVCTFNDISSKPASYVLTGLQAKLVTGARLSLLVFEFNICYRESYSVGV